MRERLKRAKARAAAGMAGVAASVPRPSVSGSWVRAELLTLEPKHVSFWCEDVAVDLRMRIAWCAQGPISLRPLEVRLLEFLFERPSQLIPSTEVLLHLYGGISEDSARSRLRSLIAEMRRRMGDGLSRSLRTARGLGFILYASPRAVVTSSTSAPTEADGRNVSALNG